MEIIFVRVSLDPEGVVAECFMLKIIYLRSEQTTTTTTTTIIIIIIIVAVVEITHTAPSVSEGVSE